MPTPIAWLLGILAVAFLVLVIVISAKRERERTEALKRLAETLGLTFQPAPDLTTIRSMGKVQLFDRGNSRRAKNLMMGPLEDQQVAVFDYSFTTGSGKSQQTHQQTVVLMPSAKPTLPDLQMAPESPFYKIAEVFGYQDIDIESSPEFSRLYLVKGVEEEAIRSALYPRATTYFADHPGWTVEVQSGTVAIYRANQRAKTDEVRAFVSDAFAAVANL